ncbi:hypothetical protein XELAEV_18031371mg [Xenopus laevis]|uniref:Reverse transcriptase domain-containing protein n=1 Tax=Xenopus laevis TaxID=8355 RepID=A0A974CML7_XENLA|nr:hypothetical protein XELAEV_18031371mg [Xenopus laevis]
MDVDSLYTNIPHKDGIDACKTFLEKHDLPSQAVVQLTKLYGTIVYVRTQLKGINHSKHSKQTFINRGYIPMIVDQYIHAATRIPRTHLLQYKQKPEINWVSLVVTYNPQLRTLRKIARDLQGTLHKGERLKSIFSDPPLLAFRQPPNLKSLITRSALLQPTKNGTYPCGKKQCKTCPHILTFEKINSRHIRGIQYPLSPPQQFYSQCGVL